MPRFFFDTDDGFRQVRDEVGIDLRAVEDAATEVFGLLRDLAHVNLYVGKHVLTADVRNAAGATVYRATMTMTGERL